MVSKNAPSVIVKASGLFQHGVLVCSAAKALEEKYRGAKIKKNINPALIFLFMITSILECF